MFDITCYFNNEGLYDYLKKLKAITTYSRCCFPSFRILFGAIGWDQGNFKRLLIVQSSSEQACNQCTVAQCIVA